MKVTAKVERVVDGDTFHGELHIEVPKRMKITLFDQKFRLLGVDTPERKEKGYEEATQFTREMIEGKEVELEWYDEDAFGRHLCKVYLEDGKCLNDLLLEKHLAEVYKRRTQSSQEFLDNKAGQA